MRSSSTSPNPRRGAWRVAIVAVCLGAVAPAGVAAAGDVRLPSQYLRQDWRTEEGFPGGAVYAIAQTPDGYLWIGSEKGLVRFDGVAFRLVEPAAGPRSVTRVLGLLTDAQGTLWIRLQGARLLRRRNGRFEEVLPSAAMPEIAVTAMARGRDGHVLMATLLNGILRHDGVSFTTLATNAALPRSLVIALAEAPDGRVLIGTRDAGLFGLSGGHLSPLAPDRLDPKINCVLAVDDNDVLIGTDKGVVRWDGQQVRRIEVPGPDTVQALGFLRDRDGHVWMGTAARGLLNLSIPSAPLAGGASGRGAVNALFEDREGNIWMGGDRGIARLRAGAFVTYATPEGLPSDGGGPIHVDGGGRAWVAPASGGLYTLTNGRPAIVPDPGLQRDVVYTMAGGAGALWVGRQRGGLTRLTLTGRSVGVTSYTRADGLAQDSVYAVHQSRDGTVWAGTLSAGVSLLRDGRFTTITAADGLLSNTVASMLDTVDGAMWFGTPRGLSVLAGGRWRGYTVQEGLPSNDVHCLLEDSAGLLWIGTSEGLAYHRAGRVHAVPGVISPALAEPIFGLAEDRHGALWIATAAHVLQVNRARLASGALTDADIRAFSVADGLRSVEGVKRHRSVAIDGRGRVWFSLGAGLSMVDPDVQAGASAPALVHVQDVTVDGTPVDLGGGARIASSRQRITFSYAGLSLSAPERVRFRYRVEGFDADWSAPVTTREAVYANLRPGTYRFRVIASNSDGLWNGAEASLPFEVEPAVWQRAWFQLAGLAAVGLLVWGGYRVRVRALARQLNVRFEERLAERTRIAQELHDTLLQGFVSASMQLDVATDRVPEGSGARVRLGRVQELMRQVIDEGRNAVRGLRASPADSDDLEQALLRTRRDMAAEDTGDFRVIVEGRPRALHPLIRDEVYRVGREALVNAFRHAGASTVEVELDYGADDLRVLVRDNGRGIDPEVQRAGREGHWGLSGMRERADRIGARFTVWSRTGAGTEVELLVPGHVAFVGPARTRRGVLAWFLRRPRRRASDGENGQHP